MIKTIALAVILLILFFSCFRLVVQERTKADLKRDRVELGHIK